MKDSINFSFLNNAARLRTSNPLVNLLLLAIIVVAVPLILAFGLLTFLSFAIIARARMIGRMLRGQSIAPTRTAKRPNITFEREKQPSKSDDGFADYVIVEEELGK